MHLDLVNPLIAHIVAVSKGFAPGVHELVKAVIRNVSEVVVSVAVFSVDMSLSAEVEVVHFSSSHHVLDYDVKRIQPDIVRDDDSPADFPVAVFEGDFKFIQIIGHGSFSIFRFKLVYFFQCIIIRCVFSVLPRRNLLHGNAERGGKLDL